MFNCKLTLKLEFHGVELALKFIMGPSRVIAFYIKYSE